MIDLDLAGRGRGQRLEVTDAGHDLVVPGGEQSPVRRERKRVESSSAIAGETAVMIRATTASALDSIGMTPPSDRRLCGANRGLASLSHPV